jgi:hypothetical protein
VVDPKKYVVGPDASISDIDLEDEEFYSGGQRLTDARADSITGEVLRRRGRPSLSGGAHRSPQLTTRVSPDLEARVRERATREGKKTSEIIREALEQYV